jgi:hypothetical protein
MEKKWDTVTPADLKRLFVSGTYMSRWSQRVNILHHTLEAKFKYMWGTPNSDHINCDHCNVKQKTTLHSAWYYPSQSISLAFQKRQLTCKYIFLHKSSVLTLWFLKAYKYITNLSCSIKHKEVYHRHIFSYLEYAAQPASKYEVWYQCSNYWQGIGSFTLSSYYITQLIHTFCFIKPITPHWIKGTHYFHWYIHKISYIPS